MKVFGIKHRPTGEWMPCRMFRTSARGWSYWNPGSNDLADKPYDANPRLFFTLQAARNALAMWLPGPRRVVMSQGSYWDGPPEPVGVAASNPPSPRKREDMEIVQLVLSGL